MLFYLFCLVFFLFGTYFFTRLLDDRIVFFKFFHFFSIINSYFFYFTLLLYLFFLLFTALFLRLPLLFFWLRYFLFRFFVYTSVFSVPQAANPKVSTPAISKLIFFIIDPPLHLHFVVITVKRRSPSSTNSYFLFSISSFNFITSINYLSSTLKKSY